MGWEGGSFKRKNDPDRCCDVGGAGQQNMWRSHYKKGSAKIKQRALNKSTISGFLI